MEKVTKLDGGTLEERVKEMKEFLGLRPEQSFQDLDVDVDEVENDSVIKKFLDVIKEKPLTDEEHQRAMSNEFDYLDEDDENDR